MHARSSKFEIRGKSDAISTRSILPAWKLSFPLRVSVFVMNKRSCLRPNVGHEREYSCRPINNLSCVPMQIMCAAQHTFCYTDYTYRPTRKWNCWWPPERFNHSHRAGNLRGYGLISTCCSYTYNLPLTQCYTWLCHACDENIRHFFTV